MCCDIVERDEAERERLPLWSYLHVHRYVMQCDFFEIELASTNDNLNIVLIVHVTGTGMGAAAVFERGDSVDNLANARVTNGGGHQNNVERLNKKQ